MQKIGTEGCKPKVAVKTLLNGGKCGEGEVKNKTRQYTGAKVTSFGDPEETT